MVNIKNERLFSENLTRIICLPWILFDILLLVIHWINFGKPVRFAKGDAGLPKPPRKEPKQKE